MRQLTTGMMVHLESDNPVLATLWRIVTKDGNIYTYTDFSETIVYNLESYTSLSGINRTAIQFNSDLTDDNLNISGFINTVLTKDELLNGKLDGAEVKIFLVNPFSVSDGEINILSGRFGRVTVEDEIFTVELNSIVSKLATKSGISCSPTCRAQLGDLQCQVDLIPYTTTGSIIGITANKNILVSITNNTLDFTQGIIKWTSGLNNGSVQNVKAVIAGELKLYYFPNRNIQVGDTFEITQGCNKLYDTCKNVYNNTVNFRGEPNIPGSDKYYFRVNGKAGVRR